MTTASKTEVLNWIGYWDRSSQGPNFGAVKTEADMVLCRRFNPVLQTATTAHLSDTQLFGLLQEYRGATA